jgi:hypothetical protein
MGSGGGERFGSVASAQEGDSWVGAGRGTRTCLCILMCVLCTCVCVCVCVSCVHVCVPQPQEGSRCVPAESQYKQFQMCCLALSQDGL